MGYNTSFSLSYRKAESAEDIEFDEDIVDYDHEFEEDLGEGPDPFLQPLIEAMREIREEGFSCIGTGPWKWYEHVGDMVALSRRFPEVLFTLHGEGEESGDIWRKYFLGGKVQVARATITFDDFDPAKLEEPRRGS